MDMGQAIQKELAAVETVYMEFWDMLWPTLLFPEMAAK
jgi:hypothetical protein